MDFAASLFEQFVLDRSAKLLPLSDINTNELPLDLDELAKENLLPMESDFNKNKEESYEKPQLTEMRNMNQQQPAESQGSDNYEV
ncbi:unnamed protein product [Bursaphelenchus okinawaensis]|uniref:Uncharacterized protein n=1 Tax=Bursaphelenchus okinawaensis TaxID=465554 RepID=A0A811LMG1_9BILA|nr:unnamed protein product [Bursaphelenchus okinawaensis]CAG9127153.1 unnamed protein product [Bursaphelenchus okinawaensis]